MEKFLMKMLKNFMSEIGQVTWIPGKQLTLDTTYVLLFSVILMVFFFFVDLGLDQIVKEIIKIQ